MANEGQMDQSTFTQQFNKTIFSGKEKMINKEIENITQLRVEYSRLQELRDQQEEDIRNDLKEIKNNLKPFNVVSNILFAKKRPANLLANSLVFGISLLAGNIFFKKSANLTKSIAAYLVQNIASNFISSKSDSILERVKRLFKFKKKNNPSQLDVLKEEEDVMFI